MRREAVADAPAISVVLPTWNAGPGIERLIEAGVDVFFRPPERILDEIGATEVTEIDSPDDAVVPVECFAASGRNEHVEWCYAAGGSLVSFLRGPSAKGWRSFVATDVA